MRVSIRVTEMRISIRVTEMRISIRVLDLVVSLVWGRVYRGQMEPSRQSGGWGYGGVAPD